MIKASVVSTSATLPVSVVSGPVSPAVHNVQVCQCAALHALPASRFHTYSESARRLCILTSSPVTLSACITRRLQTKHEFANYRRQGETGAERGGRDIIEFIDCACECRIS